jgi:hypothetical protein
MLQNGCEIRGHFKFDLYVIKMENTMTNIYYGFDFFFVFLVEPIRIPFYILNFLCDPQVHVRTYVHSHIDHTYVLMYVIFSTVIGGDRRRQLAVIGGENPCCEPTTFYTVYSPFRFLVASLYSFTLLYTLILASA